MFLHRVIIILRRKGGKIVRFKVKCSQAISMFKIFVNFKTYLQGTGERAVLLAKILQEVQDELSSKVEIIPIVQTADLFLVKKAVRIPVWVQHLDFQPQGKFTGWANLETVIEAGASGTLLNHSEHQISPGTVKQVISRIENCKTCPELAEGLKIKNFEVMVCCKTLGQIERLAKLKPDYIGYEISELIGGEVSITQDNTKAIKHAKEICGKIALVVGAGIHQSGDLVKAGDLGASGVLISSAVVLAEKPKEKILELLSLLREG